MKSSKERILDIFQATADAGISDALLVADSKGNISSHDVSHLVLQLEGLSVVEFFRDGNLVRIEKGAGTAQYCSAKGYMCFQSSFPMQGISFSYYGDFIRYMYINSNGKDAPPTERDIILHSKSPVSALGGQLIVLLDKLAETGESTTAAKSLLEALLRITIESIRNEGENVVGVITTPHKLWLDICDHIRNNFKNDLSRDSIAKIFRISPSHVSHLFKKFAVKDFSHTLMECRLEHATRLLRNRKLTVDEIADQCNYKYTSYFLRCFKNKYKMTPKNYRINFK